MEMAEVWKSVVDYKGVYEVSDHGRVRSLDRIVTHSNGRQHRHPGKPIRLVVNKGYHQVVLHKDGEITCKRVHRLVLESFTGPCPDDMEACHNDGKRLNNVPSNLRWDTRESNTADRAIHGNLGNNRGERCGGVKLNEDQVRFIKSQAELGDYTQREIANWFGVSQSTISMINTGENWSWL